MTKEELKKEAENWLRKYLLCCNCEKKCNCIDSNSYCEEQVLQAYVDSAEPREKRIEELEKENAELKEKLEMGIALKDEEIGCIQTDFNTFKSKAKDLLLRFVELKNKPCAVGHSVNMLLYENICADVKQFIKDSEVEK